MVSEGEEESLPDILPVADVPVTVPLRGDLDASAGDNREVATALAAIMSRLDAQQTQLNAIQNRVLLADLSRTGTACSGGGRFKCSSQGWRL
jgi:hypothetical protein